MSELVVALDFPDRAGALAMARTVSPAAGWVKVGLELYCAEGPDVVRELKDAGLRVFVDLKFFDIPNTVRGAVRSAVRAGADMVNIHTLGGARMAEAAREGLDGAPAGAKPLLLGVTVLTSMDEADMDAMGGGRSVSDLVVHLAGRAKAYYLDGVVCSGREVRAVKAACGTEFACLTPGIRLAGGADEDQRRVVTPHGAALDGSDYLVVGRPVTTAPDPLAAAREMAAQMERGARHRGMETHG